MDYQKKLTKAMAELDEENVLKYVQIMLASGYSHAAIRKCLTEGSEEVGNYFEDGEYFIADLIVSGMSKVISTISARILSSACSAQNASK